MSADEEKAKEYLHLTSSQAAQIASQANAKKLILLHFSQRYKDIKEMEDEAKTIFPETVCAYDFMKIRI
jgi:ribonuclease Z